MSVHYEQLAIDGLLHIGAATAHAQLDSIAQQAAAHWSHSHFLGRLLEPEIAARALSDRAGRASGARGNGSFRC